MKIQFLFLKIILLLTPILICGQNAVIDAIVEDEIIKQNIPGVAIGIIKNGNLYYAKGYGVKHITNATPVTTNTIFRWASISKPLTAVAAFQLDEKQNNGFEIEDKVKDHVSYWPSLFFNPKRNVTIEHLLTHRSGINHYGDGAEEDNIYDNNSSNTYVSDADHFNAESSVSIFKNPALDFKPGTKFLYSSYGYNLLGATIDEASPNGYPKWVKDNIATPLGMSSLKISTGTFKGYQKKCDGIINARSIGNVEWKLPGGGWQSNIKDLAKFAMGIMNDKLLNDTSRLWTGSPNTNNNAYGVYTKGSGNNLRIWHSGAHGNVNTLMHLYPNKKIGVVIMVNANYANCDRIKNRIYTAIGTNWPFDDSPKDACTNTMKNCGDQLIGVWRKTNKDVIIRRGYNHIAFGKEWSKLRTKGYYCDDFEAYTKNGKTVWDGVFKKGNGGNPMWRNFDQASFYTKWKEQSEKGYRLIDLETYVVNGKRKWAGLFRPGNGTYALWRNFSTADFAVKRNEMAQQGKKLIDIEVYTSGGELKWSGVWIAGNDGLLNRNYSTDAFNALWKKRLKKGYKLIDIEAYKVNGELRWAGIWEKSTRPEYLNRNVTYCDFMNNHTDYSSRGYELIDLENYNSNSRSKQSNSQEIILTDNITNEKNKHSIFSLYPNPTKGILNIHSKENDLKIINVYTIIGTKVFSKTINTSSIDLSGLFPGIYLIQVIQGDKKILKKIVLQ